MFRIVSSKSIVLKPLPEWPKGDEPEIFDLTQVRAAIKRQAPKSRIVTSDAKFVAIPAELVDPIIEWTLSAMARLNFGFVPESRDCDKFAKVLTLVFEMVCAEAGIKAQALALRVHVKQQQAWAKVRAGGGHAVVAIHTTEGPVVIEPQNGIRCPLELYPNRNHIFRVLLGG
jgi:hypothetical protein